MERAYIKVDHVKAFFISLTSHCQCCYKKLIIPQQSSSLWEKKEEKNKVKWTLVTLSKLPSNLQKAHHCYFTLFHLYTFLFFSNINPTHNKHHHIHKMVQTPNYNHIFIFFKHVYLWGQLTQRKVAKIITTFILVVCLY